MRSWNGKNKRMPPMSPKDLRPIKMILLKVLTDRKTPGTPYLSLITMMHLDIGDLQVCL